MTRHVAVAFLRSLAANLILLGLILIALGVNAPILLGGLNSAVP